MEDLIESDLWSIELVQRWEFFQEERHGEKVFLPKAPE
jgi:hypothetical protein